MFMLVVMMSLAFSACSSGGNSTPPPPTTYTIGGTAINLAGTNGGLVLQDNGSDSLSVNADGSFTFTTAIASGGTYNVTILTQPSSPAQSCEVTHGTGTATANVTSVAVDCGHNEWTWMNGSNVINQKGTYGTLGTAATTNVPGARGSVATWTDASGNFWLFGGVGYDSTPYQGQGLNDLWKYSAGEWTWVNGANVADQPGTYGTLGTAATTNLPGARCCAAAWTDASGNFWLFGGYGYDSNGNIANLNDLWKYSAGEWTWVNGANVGGFQPGTYGTLGKAAATNLPGERHFFPSWTDASGNFWLFGGEGIDSAGNMGFLNDLWKYSAGEWTWMGGSNVINQKGTYGTLGTAATTNVPGARWQAVGWADSAGNFWLFGGEGIDSAGNDDGDLNDLWKYSAGEWTWMGGSNVINQKGTYGTLGTAATTNVPGARVGATTWTDASGNFWLFGGAGYDSAGNEGALNDLWKYSAGKWTWVNGANVIHQKGTYGTLGTAATTNVPGARGSVAIWTDASGNFWLFGGSGYDSAGNGGILNDLWKYEP
jgi:N-acetylneuraminic acid mutarotase